MVRHLTIYTIIASLAEVFSSVGNIFWPICPLLLIYYYPRMTNFEEPISTGISSHLGRDQLTLGKEQVVSSGQCGIYIPCSLSLWLLMITWVPSAVWDIYPMFIEPMITYDYLGPFDNVMTFRVRNPVFVHNNNTKASFQQFFVKCAVSVFAAMMIGSRPFHGWGTVWISTGSCVNLYEVLRESLQGPV